MWHKVPAVINSLLELYKTNPVLAGIASLYGLGVATFFLKDVPRRIWYFICDQATTTLTLNSQDRVYYDMLLWVSKNKFHSFVRNLNLNNARWGERDKAKLSIGYGTMYFTFQGRLFKFVRHEVEANQTEYMKERITVTVLGRNHNVFKSLVEEVTKRAEDDSVYTKVFKCKDSDWQYMTKKYKRELDTVVLDKRIKDSIINHLDRFLSEKEQAWYINSGVTYKTGILLTGMPGTGKTSLIRALCAHYDKSLYILSLNGMSDVSLVEALSNVPEGSIVVIEDIDGYNVNLNRAPVRQEGQSDGVETPTSFLTISGVLNAIDGITSAEKVVLIATTNYPEKLDKALLREGRFDLILELGYMTDETFREYFNKFFPEVEVPTELKIKEKLAPCTVQKLVFDNRSNPHVVLEQVKQ